MAALMWWVEIPTQQHTMWTRGKNSSATSCRLSNKGLTVQMSKFMYTEEDTSCLCFSTQISIAKEESPHDLKLGWCYQVQWKVVLGDKMHKEHVYLDLLIISSICWLLKQICTKFHNVRVSFTDSKKPYWYWVISWLQGLISVQFSACTQTSHLVIDRSIPTSPNVHKRCKTNP